MPQDSALITSAGLIAVKDISIDVADVLLVSWWGRRLGGGSVCATRGPTHRQAHLAQKCCLASSPPFALELRGSGTHPY